MTKQEMVERIIEFVKDRGGGVSFVELQDMLGAESQGDYFWEVGAPNLVIWAGMSELFIDALEEVRNRQALVMHPAEFLTYLIDGRALKFPIVKRFRKQGFKEPHWLPTVLWTRDDAQKLGFWPPRKPPRD